MWPSDRAPASEAWSPGQFARTQITLAKAGQEGTVLPKGLPRHVGEWGPVWGPPRAAGR